MRKIIIRYGYRPFERTDGRRNSSEMRRYLEGLVDEMRSAGIDAEYEDSVTVGDGVNTVSVNGTDVMRILDGLEIRVLDRDDHDPDMRPRMVRIERPDTDWNRDEIEDIPDVMMKNAISKAYADTDNDGTL